MCDLCAGGEVRVRGRFLFVKWGFQEYLLYFVVLSTYISLADLYFFMYIIRATGAWTGFQGLHFSVKSLGKWNRERAGLASHKALSWL